MNDVDARIGDGANARVVIAGDALSVDATTSARPDVTAAAQSNNSVKTRNTPQPDREVKVGKRPLFKKDDFRSSIFAPVNFPATKSIADSGTGIAITLDVIQGETKATISKGARVDSAAAITVNAETLNEIDLNSLWGVNLFLDRTLLQLTTLTRPVL